MPRALSENDADAIPNTVAQEITGKVLAGFAGDPSSSSSSTRSKRPSRAPFGIKGFDVAKFLISMAAAVAVAYFGMKEAIEHNTAAIDSNSQELEEAFEHVDAQAEKLEKHEAEQIKADKELEKRVGTVERTTDRIEVKQEQTLDAIKELKDDLRDARRRERRSR